MNVILNVYLLCAKVYTVVQWVDFIEKIHNQCENVLDIKHVYRFTLLLFV